MDNETARTDGFLAIAQNAVLNAELFWVAVETFSVLVLFIGVFLLGRWLMDRITSYDVALELTEKDNTALALSQCGYFLAITIIFVGAFLGPDEVTRSFVEGLGQIAAYSLLGITLLLLSRLINDKLILHTFDNTKEIIDDRNAGTGAVQFGSYVASGLIIAGSIHGEDGGPLSAIVFFIVGQISLIVFTRIYDLVTPFNVHDEIEKDNVAAGVAFGGTLIALGIILMNAASGDFVSWTYNLIVFGEKSIMAFVMLPIFRLVLDKIFIKHSDLNHEIVHDRNLGAGLLEMANAIGFSVVLYFLLV